MRQKWCWERATGFGPPPGLELVGGGGIAVAVHSTNGPTTEARINHTRSLSRPKSDIEAGAKQGSRFRDILHLIRPACGTSDLAVVLQITNYWPPQTNCVTACLCRSTVSGRWRRLAGPGRTPSACPWPAV